jgi:TRAP-type C4-dicarboxylate transport system permease large subunit
VKNLFGAGKRYMRTMDLSDMALLKLCLISSGILFGLMIPTEAKKRSALAAGFVFVVTYLPLMHKFFPALTQPEE